jgi:hypothetical protein
VGHPTQNTTREGWCFGHSGRWMQSAALTAD